MDKDKELPPLLEQIASALREDQQYVILERRVSFLSNEFSTHVKESIIDHLDLKYRLAALEELEKEKKKFKLGVATAVLSAVGSLILTAINFAVNFLKKA